MIESDVSGWHFRRYQAVVDVEVYVEKNPASAHTASYVREEAEKEGRLTDADVANVFVTEYERSDGVERALIKFARRLSQESGYVVEEAKLGGQRVFRVTGHGEAWAFWSSGKFVVKVGGRGMEKVPGGLVEAYGKHYPSKLAAGALEGPIHEDEPKVQRPGDKPGDKSDKPADKKKGEDSAK